jgi:hypothetical protein
LCAACGLSVCRPGRQRNASNRGSKKHPAIPLIGNKWSSHNDLTRAGKGYSSIASQYKGSGTLNGVPGYDFLLTLRDGQLCGSVGADGIRMKITSGGGGLRYDNMSGSDDIGQTSGKHDGRTLQQG